MSDYNSIKLEKGMYSANKGFGACLEELDPSINYKGTSLENTDAFARQLKRFDIHVGGVGGDRVEKFFQTSDSATLFPEYISRAVRQGIKENDILPDILACTTNISGLDYRSIAVDNTDDDLELKNVAEGALIPSTKITTSENLVKLTKTGRMLVSSYEAIRGQRIDVFTVTLKQIGAYIARSRLEKATTLLGTSATAVDVTNASTLYDKLLELWSEMNPYKLGAILVSYTDAKSILKLDEFKKSTADDFNVSGRFVTPFGAKLIVSSAATDGKIIGIDTSCALEMIESGTVTTEYDKLIDRQLERAAITDTYGFNIIVPDAVKKA